MNKQIFELGTGTPELTDFLVYQKSDGSIEAKKTAISSLLNLATAQIKITIDSADILTSNSSPIELIAAPGVGKIIFPTSALIVYNFGTAGYTTNTTTNLKLGLYHTLWTSPNLIAQAQDAVQFATLSEVGAVVAPVPSNTALTFTSSTGDPAAGDGTLDIYINYSIITL